MGQHIEIRTNPTATRDYDTFLLLATRTNTYYKHIEYISILGDKSGRSGIPFYPSANQCTFISPNYAYQCTFPHTIAITNVNEVCYMEEVQIRANIERKLKESVTQKAKAEGKTIKDVLVELLTSYVGRELEPVQLTFSSPSRQPKEEVKTTTPSPNQLRPEDFDNHLDYVDYLERNGLID